MSDDPNPTYKDVVQCVIDNLIEERDALGAMLSHSLGAMSDSQLAEEINSYVTKDEWTIESLVKHVVVLSEILPVIDTKTVMVLFKCTKDEANEAIRESAKYAGYTVEESESGSESGESK